MKMKFNLSPEAIGKLIRDTPYGKSFIVATDGERRTALMVAKGTGKRIHTRINAKGGGFKIHILE